MTYAKPQTQSGRACPLVVFLPYSRYHVDFVYALLSARLQHTLTLLN